MQITTSVTDDYDVKCDFFEGPLLASIILSLQDEKQVLATIQNAFRDARALKAGFSREEVEEMNRERAGATEE